MAGFFNDGTTKSNAVFADNADFSGSTTNPSVTNGLQTDGQIWTGSTAVNAGGTHVNVGKIVSLTSSLVVGYSGPNITLTDNGGAAFSWSDTSGGFTAVRNNGYFITATATATLPNTPTLGDTISFIVDTANVLTIQCTGTQKIRVGATVSASAGTSLSTARGDAITLIYRQTGNTWIALSSEGNWNTV